MKSTNLLFSLILTALIFGVSSLSNAQGLLSHDFNDGDMGPFVECTTQNPNFSEVVNNRLRTYWEQTSYNSNRVSRGAEACGDPSNNGIGYLTYKHCWMGFTMNVDRGYMGPSFTGVGSLAQIFGFNDDRGQFSWTALLEIENGDLVWIDRRGIGSIRDKAIVYENIPRGQDMDIVLHAVLSGSNRGLAEVFVNGELLYSAYNISIGMGDFDSNDVQTNTSYTEFKIGQYNHSNASANEIRIVDYDNISWYDGADGYNIVDPSGGATPVPITGSSFTPDPNRTYYIDVPEHNLRLAATGEAEDAYTISTNTTGANVEWQFVDKGNGSWHVQLAADVSKPRLRTRNNGGETDMQATSSDGTWTYWDFTTGSSSNTYFFTLPDGPGDLTRLQVDREGDINMVTPSHNGTWESFRITAAGFATTNGTVVQIRKRNATGFAFDGGNGGENGQNLYLWGANQNNINQQWIEIDRGNGYYSYQKMGTDYCIDGNGGGSEGQNVYLWACSDNNQNQHWKKVSTAGGSFRLEKRNSPAYSLDGNRGGENGQNVYLWNSDSNNQNQQWLITPIGSAKSVAAIVATSEVIVYPNPVVNTATVQGAANTTISIYDVSGQQLLVKEIATDSEEIDLSVLPTGIYYGQVVGVQSISAIKIVKK